MCTVSHIHTQTLIIPLSHCLCLFSLILSFHSLCFISLGFLSSIFHVILFLYIYSVICVFLVQISCDSPFSISTWHLVWSSAAGSHLLQGSMCCAFGDALVFTMVVMSGDFGYCYLFICCGHSPLTSDINMGLWSRELIWSLFQAILC